MFFIIGITSGIAELGFRSCGYFPCCSLRGKTALVTCVYKQFTFSLFPCFVSGKDILFRAQTAEPFMKSIARKENELNAAPVQR